MFRLLNHYINGPALILVSAETFYFAMQSLAIYKILTMLNFHIHPDFNGARTTYMAFFTTTSMGCAGLYNRQHFVKYMDVISRLIVILPIVLIIMIAALFIKDRLVDGAFVGGSSIFCLITITVFSLTLLIWRAGFIKMIDNTDIFKRRIVILGTGKRAANIEKLSADHQHRTINIIGYIRLGDAPTETAAPYEECRRTENRRTEFWVPSSDLSRFCLDHKVEEVVVASMERRGQLPVKDLLACKFRGIQITEYSTYWERESGQVDPDEVCPSWMVFSNGFSVGIFRSFVKRAFDIVVSSLMLLMTLPLTLTTALLIVCESKGPVFYRQERVGLHGACFNVLKFRSMSTDAEKDGPRWAMKNDSRVTRVGNFIRKVRIDEIPQALNVLMGSMSFVGPRPERPVFVKVLAEKIPYYNERHAIKPGITGWAQVNYPYGATEHDAKMKLAYDLYSIKNGGLFLDIIIMTQTVKAVIWNSGAR